MRFSHRRSFSRIYLLELFAHQLRPQCYCSNKELVNQADSYCEGKYVAQRLLPLVCRNRPGLWSLKNNCVTIWNGLPCRKCPWIKEEMDGNKAKKKSRGRVSIAPALFTHIKEKEFSVLNSDSDSGGRAWRHIRLNLPLSVKIFVAILQTP